MTLKIYNTLTRSKEIFQPLNTGKVGMYVCGPTVYDYIHLGNARPLIIFDVVRKHLASLGYDVNYIVNFTDVDDKLIRRAEEMGETVPQIAARFIEAYFEDARALGIQDATVHPRVTDNIPEIIAFIEGLVRLGNAYESGGDVYFRTHLFPEYGNLSQQNLEELQFGARVEVGERKENQQDFVLWKTAKPGEISWPSPWGEGRPGWHIECSAMVHKYLGDTIDIHAGGQDLQFPHHECEIAQSEALTRKPMARYWMHNGYIHINDEKMSKSLGNGINVKQLLKTASPYAIRYFMLSTHYRNPLNFSDETIQQAESGLARIENCLANVRHRMNIAEKGEPSSEFVEAITHIEQKFDQKMADDFNTPDAITAVFELVSLANLHLQQDRVSEASLQRILDGFDRLNRALGIIREQSAAGLLDADVERLIVERAEARNTKDWARADEIRDLLTGQGIVLEDTPQGLRWRRK